MQNRGHGLFFAKRRVGKSEQVPEAKKAKKKDKKGERKKPQKRALLCFPPSSGCGKEKVICKFYFPFHFSLPRRRRRESVVWEGGGRGGSFVVWGLGLGPGGGQARWRAPISRICDRGREKSVFFLPEKWSNHLKVFLNNRVIEVIPCNTSKPEF